MQYHNVNLSQTDLVVLINALDEATGEDARVLKRRLQSFQAREG